jgi:hypothetical protein
MEINKDSHKLNFLKQVVVVFVATRGATATSTEMANFTGAEGAQCVFWFEEAKSAPTIHSRSLMRVN